MIKLSITTSQKSKAFTNWLKKIGIDSDLIDGYDTITIEMDEDTIKQLPSNENKNIKVDINEIKSALEE